MTSHFHCLFEHWLLDQWFTVAPAVFRSSQDHLNDALLCPRSQMPPMSLFTDALQFHAAFLWMPLALEDMVSSDRACPGLAGLSQGLERLSQPVGLDAGCHIQGEMLQCELAKSPLSPCQNAWRAHAIIRLCIHFCMSSDLGTFCFLCARTAGPCFLQ